MTRIIIAVLLSTFALGGRASAEFLTAVDATRYPAEISLIIEPQIAIANVAEFFTQTGTPFNIGGLNTIMTSHPFPIPANVQTDIGPTFPGGFPLPGVSKTFISQYDSLLGTYGDADNPTGLVALLAPGVGLGKTFNEVFPGEFSETDVINALVGLRFGNTNGVGLLFQIMADSLDKQPKYTAVGPDSYVLGPAELIKFSVGTSAGEVISGAYQVPDGSQPVPEPGSLISALLGIATCLGLTRYKRKVSC